MEGGKDWWLQITEAIDHVEFLVLVMTPAALALRVRPARVALRPPAGQVRDPGDRRARASTSPRCPAGCAARTSSTPTSPTSGAASSAPSRRRARPRARRSWSRTCPTIFVRRPRELEPLIASLLDQTGEEPVAITAALQGRRRLRQDHARPRDLPRRGDPERLRRRHPLGHPRRAAGRRPGPRRGPDRSPHQRTAGLQTTGRRRHAPGRGHRRSAHADRDRRCLAGGARPPVPAGRPELRAPDHHPQPRRPAAQCDARRCRRHAGERGDRAARFGLPRSARTPPSRSSRSASANGRCS